MKWLGKSVVSHKKKKKKHKKLQKKKNQRIVSGWVTPWVMRCCPANVCEGLGFCIHSFELRVRRHWPSKCHGRQFSWKQDGQWDKSQKIRAVENKWNLHNCPILWHWFIWGLPCHRDINAWPRPGIPSEIFWHRGPMKKSIKSINQGAPPPKKEESLLSVIKNNEVCQMILRCLGAKAGSGRHPWHVRVPDLLQSNFAVNLLRIPRSVCWHQLAWPLAGFLGMAHGPSPCPIVNARWWHTNCVLNHAKPQCAFFMYNNNYNMFVLSFIFIDFNQWSNADSRHWGPNPPWYRSV